MPAEQKEPAKVTMGDAFGLLYLIAYTHATAITPIIRKGFGSEAFNPYALFAMGVMLLLTGGRWVNGMGLYLAAWFVALVLRRIESFNLWRSGIVLHSRYMGYPWLAMKFRFIQDARQGKWLEPFLCLAAGGVMYAVAQTLGLFIMAGFISLPLCLFLDKFAVYKRVQNLQDARIEGEYYAEEFRRGR